MRRTVWALLAAGLAITGGAAAAEVRGGIWGGANLARLEIEDLPENEHEGRTAPAFGASLAWRPGDAWSLELRPSYVGRGAKVLIAGSHGVIEATLIELPLLITRDLGGGRVRPYLLAGVAVGWVRSATAVLGSTEQDISDDFGDTDTSLRAGAGARLRHVSGQPFLELEYTHGFTDLNTRSDGLGSGVGAIRNRGVQIRGGISFGLTKH